MFEREIWDESPERIIKKKLNLGLSIDNIVSLIGWTSGEQYSIYPSLSFSSELNLNKNTILNEISISSSMHDIKKNIEFHAGYNRDINEKNCLSYWNYWTRWSLSC